MNRFYIKSINAYKPDGTVSSLEFKKDINVICGPTNTGKTYVFEAISFMMGGRKFKDGGDNFGYNVFELILTNDTDNISIKRNIYLQKYDVNSSFDFIKSGTYYTNKKSTQNIHSLYFKLMNINDDVFLPSRKDINPIKISFNMLKNLIFIDYLKVQSKYSPFFGEDFTRAVILKSYIYFLLGKLNYLEWQEKFQLNEVIENNKNELKNLIKEIKELNLERQKLVSQNNLVDKYLDPKTSKQIADKFTSVVNYIGKMKKRMKKYHTDIFEIEKNIENAQLRLYALSELNKFLKSDNERIDALKELSIKSKDFNLFFDIYDDIPFYVLEREYNNNLEYIAINNQEIQNTKILIKDLRCQLDETMKNQQLISNKINDEFEPLRIDYEITYDEIIKSINNLNNIDILDKKINDKKRLKNEITNKNLELFEFVPSTYFKDSNDEMSIKINGILNNILHKCNYHFYNEVNIDIQEFDMRVDNLRKKDYSSGGYCSFYNTILFLAMREYFDVYGKYKPFIYMIDSPLTQLKLSVNDKNEKDFKKGLYEYMYSAKSNSQLIIFDHNYESVSKYKLDSNICNLIIFDKNDPNGRHGFLIDVFDYTK